MVKTDQRPRSATLSAPPNSNPTASLCDQSHADNPATLLSFMLPSRGFHHMIPSVCEFGGEPFARRVHGLACWSAGTSFADAGCRRVAQGRGLLDDDRRAR